MEAVVLDLQMTDRAKEIIIARLTKLRMKIVFFVARAGAAANSIDDERVRMDFELKRGCCIPGYKYI